MLTFILLNIFMATVMPQDFSTYKLPKTWTSDFTITSDYSGSMDGSGSEIIITFDSIHYKHTSFRTKEGNFNFSAKLTADDRAEILKKLKELGIEKIGMKENEIAPVPVRDGYSRTLCIGKVCMNGGPGSSLNADDRSTFSTACAFLEEFAGKMKKRK
jgi:hypothetical protein